jgi:HTH-type transcriptional regulator/antitoxin HigA
MEIRPIHTNADYKAALHEVSAYFDLEPDPGTPDGDRFDVLLTLIEAYEAKNFPIDLPDPVEAIKFYRTATEQAGETPPFGPSALASRSPDESGSYPPPA